MSDRLSFSDPSLIDSANGNLAFKIIRNSADHEHLQGRVIFTGWRRDLPRIYADLDILVVSSDNEGTPVSVIEAMASGRPVVGTRVGGLPDLIAEGETGYLVPPRSADELATAILRLLQDPEAASRMGQAARAVAQERFTVQRLISDIANLYHQFLAQKGISI